MAAHHVHQHAHVALHELFGQPAGNASDYYRGDPTNSSIVFTGDSPLRCASTRDAPCGSSHAYPSLAFPDRDFRRQRGTGASRSGRRPWTIERVDFVRVFERVPPGGFVFGTARLDIDTTVPAKDRLSRFRLSVVDARHDHRAAALDTFGIDMGVTIVHAGVGQPPTRPPAMPPAAMPVSVAASHPHQRPARCLGSQKRRGLPADRLRHRPPRRYRRPLPHRLRPFRR